MHTRVPLPGVSAPNADAELTKMLDQVCAQLPHDYTRQLVRGVVRLKMEMGFVADVREYLKRRSGEYPAISPLAPQRGDA